MFSRFLAEKLAEGDRLDLTGPFGVFTLREGDNDLVFVGGGAGHGAHLVAAAGDGRARHAAQGHLLLRRPDQAGTSASRPSCTSWSRSCRASVTYRPCPSRAYDEEWEGETGLITDVVKRHASDLRGAHAYVCGPPPMVEAALPLLATLGVEEKRIYYDKFTTTGNPQE